MKEDGSHNMIVRQLTELVTWAKLEIPSPSVAIDVDQLAYWTREAELAMQPARITRKGASLHDLTRCVNELQKMRRLSR